MLRNARWALLGIRTALRKLWQLLTNARLANLMTTTGTVVVVISVLYVKEQLELQRKALDQQIDSLREQARSSEEQAIISSWQLIIGAVGHPGDLGRQRALEYLAERSISLRKVNLSGGAYLRGTELGGADLSGAVLTEAELTKANLAGADLTGSNLQNARLQEVVLRDALLSKADLRGAELSGADLRGAYLYRASLEGANLVGADFRSAVVESTNFRNARTTNTNFEGVDVSRALGLSRGRFGSKNGEPLSVSSSALRLALHVQKKPEDEDCRSSPLPRRCEDFSVHWGGEDAANVYLVALTPDSTRFTRIVCAIENTRDARPYWFCPAADQSLRGRNWISGFNTLEWGRETCTEPDRFQVLGFFYLITYTGGSFEVVVSDGLSGETCSGDTLTADLAWGRAAVGFGEQGFNPCLDRKE